MTQDRIKVYFPLEGTYVDQLYDNESIQAKPNGQLYEIDSIPFYVKGIAYRDLISIKQENDSIYFNKLEKESGNSTLRILLYNLEYAPEIIKFIEEKGCSWEGSNIESLYSVNILTKKIYKEVTEHLDSYEKKEILEYEEGCIARQFLLIQPTNKIRYRALLCMGSRYVHFMAFMLREQVIIH